MRQNPRNRGRLQLIWPLAVTALTAAACGSSNSLDPGADSVTTQAPAPPSSTAPSVVSTTTSLPPDASSTTLPATTLLAGPVVDWDDATVIADLGDGWQIHACTGEAPLLCVNSNGEDVGVVEAHAFAVATVDVIDPEAPASDNLAALAADYLAIFEADRAAGCGAGYDFAPIPPNPIELGDASALAYGFVGRMPDGTPSEVQLQYATIVEDKVLLLSASAYDEGGCPGRDDLGGFTSEQLLEIRESLEAVLSDIPLPELPTPPPPP